MSRPSGSRGHSLEPAPRPKDVVLFLNKNHQHAFDSIIDGRTLH